MKTFTLLVLCTVYILPLTAQDWEPFVFEKTYYYGQTTSDGTSVERIRLDTIEGQIRSYTFLHQILCEAWNFQISEDIYTSWEIVGDLSTDKPLFYYEDEGTIGFVFLSADRQVLNVFDFMPFIRPQESWTTHGVVMQCIAEDTMAVLGEIDSVRLYRCLTPPYTSFEFLLAKSNGLLRFPAFQNFGLTDPEEFHPEFNLIGVHDSLTSKGYKQPQFEDYFHLQAGDVLIWENISLAYFPDMLHDTTFFIDTILSVSQNSDSIQYNNLRSIFNANGQYVTSESHSSTYFKLREGKLLEGPIRWFTNTEEDAYEFEPYYSMQPLLLDIDSFTTACLNSAFYHIDDGNCSIHPYFDNSERYCYDTQRGLILDVNDFINGSRHTRLIGSVINGILDGIVEIPTATSEVTFEQVSVFPNPVMDILNIPVNTESISIFNMHGSLMQSQRSNTPIDVSDFFPGIYILQMMNQDGSFVITRVVKQ